MQEQLPYMAKRSKGKYKISVHGKTSMIADRVNGIILWYKLGLGDSMIV